MQYRAQEDRSRQGESRSGRKEDEVEVVVARSLSPVHQQRLVDSVERPASTQVRVEEDEVLRLRARAQEPQRIRSSDGGRHGWNRVAKCRHTLPAKPTPVPMNRTQSHNRTSYGQF